MCMGIFLAMHVCVSRDYRGQKRASDPLLEIQMAVSHCAVLKMEPGSSGKAASALDH